MSTKFLYYLRSYDSELRTHGNKVSTFKRKYLYLLYINYKWTVNYILKTLIENVIQVEVQLTFSGSRKSKQCRSQFPQLHIQYFLHKGWVWPHIRGRKKERRISL